MHFDRFCPTLASLTKISQKQRTTAYRHTQTAYAIYITEVMATKISQAVYGNLNTGGTQEIDRHT